MEKAEGLPDMPLLEDENDEVKEASGNSSAGQIETEGQVSSSDDGMSKPKPPGDDSETQKATTSKSDVEAEKEIGTGGSAEHNSDTAEQQPERPEAENQEGDAEVNAAFDDADPRNGIEILFFMPQFTPEELALGLPEEQLIPMWENRFSEMLNGLCLRHKAGIKRKSSAIGSGSVLEVVEIALPASKEAASSSKEEATAPKKKAMCPKEETTAPINEPKGMNDESNAPLEKSTSMHNHHEPSAPIEELAARNDEATAPIEALTALNDEPTASIQSPTALYEEPKAPIDEPNAIGDEPSVPTVEPPALGEYPTALKGENEPSV